MVVLDLLAEMQVVVLSYPVLQERYTFGMAEQRLLKLVNYPKESYVLHQ